MFVGFLTWWRQMVFIFDSFNLQVLCKLLVDIFFFILFVQAAERIRLGTFLTQICCAVHLLLSLFF